MPADLHDATRREELKRRARALSPDAVPRWGRMTPDQMLWHLNAALSMTVGDLETRPFHTFTKRTLFKAIALYGRWPRARVKTAREFNPRGERYDFEAERERLIALIDRVGAKDRSGTWPVHPGFGPMSGRASSLLQSRHVDYHLTQFGA